MKTAHLLLTAATLLGCAVFASCQMTAPTAPPVTAAMVLSGARQHADAATLASGRAVFVSHCAHCHALPTINEHPAEKWPRIVAQMTKRSGLQPAESKAVLSYILAARAE